jgi:phosphoesterase RecJ-like protein
VTGDPNTSAWASTCELADIARWIKERLAAGERFAIVTHTKPDGDAVGSSVAVARVINRLRPGAAECWYFGALPAWLDAVAGATPRRLIDEAGLPSDAEAPRAVLVVDTGSFSQLEKVRSWLTPRREIIAAVDHHAHGDAVLASRVFVDTSAASVCLPVGELCRLLMGLPNGASLPVDVAEPLYLGLATDTGWFRYSSVTPRVLRAATDMMEAGARPNKLYEMIEQQEKPSRPRLLGRALTSLELFDNERVAVMSLTKADFTGAGAGQADAGGFIDYPLTIGTVRVGVMLNEADPPDNTGPFTKISLRSKSAGRPEDGVDVNLIAQKFGGGGHIAAAGARCRKTLDEVKREVVEAISAQMRERGL